ncbi:transposase [Succinatimonas hippei]|uniref:transposase n=1 Tax=Succinatimonas hippei TaxID=626938 RepID=UPI0023F9E120|nr:transposase [Succinatimonas hippei]
MYATVCLKFNSELIEFDGEDDHVHPVILYSPQPAGSTLVFKLKGTSSMVIRKRKYPAVRAKLWGNALGRCLFCIIMHKSSDIYYSATY